MFKDKVKVDIRAGNGGQGKIAFDRARRPIGGDGGDGGDIYLVGSTSIYDLRAFRPEEVYQAGHGDHGKQNNATGADGKDLILKVPLATVVYNNSGEKVAEVTESGQEVLLLKGGRGGLGNNYFRTRGRDKRNSTVPPDPGEQLQGWVELQLVSDWIFIGFPNAGKSSILKELTKAKAKVASYAFTTIDPQLGKTENGLVLMDLPGLIEGTVSGKGLGTDFLKHTNRTKGIAHFLSFENESLPKSYLAMRDEIASLSEQLDSKPEVIILTKHDLISSEEIEERKESFQSFLREENIYSPLLVTSVYDYDSLMELQQILKESREEIGDD